MTPSTRVRGARVLVTGLLTAAALVWSAGPASAHVEVTPDQVAPSTFTTFAFTVPNETADQDTVGVDVSIPAGFLVETAQSLPGWQTVVDTSANGTVTAVHWRGGNLPPQTFADFAVRGRAPGQVGTVRFDVTQRYESKVVRWSGAADSETPAPSVTVAKGAASGEGSEAGSGAAVATVPAAPAPAPVDTAADGEDSLARSRADLALALVVAGLLGGVGWVILQMARRSSRES